MLVCVRRTLTIAYEIVGAWTGCALLGGMAIGFVWGTLVLLIAGLSWLAPIAGLLVAAGDGMLIGVPTGLLVAVGLLVGHEAGWLSDDAKQPDQKRISAVAGGLTAVVGEATCVIVLHLANWSGVEILVLSVPPVALGTALAVWLAGKLPPAKGAAAKVATLTNFSESG
jgi:hypothetical protein